MFYPSSFLTGGSLNPSRYTLNPIFSFWFIIFSLQGMYYSNAEQFKETCGYEINGFWYPRVTKIVEIKAKPALYRFYANMNNFAEGEQIKQRSATEGTMIHEAVEGILTGKKPEIPEQIRPSIKAFMEFLIDRHIQVDP